MAELLIAVAILAVLTAIAIPFIVSQSRNLKATELDVHAREIFLAAENRITALRASGELGTLTGSVELSAKPSDFPGTDEEWAAGGYRYTLKGTAAAKALLPLGSVDDGVRGNHYIIEYNEKTGAVYGVFYAEDTLLAEDVYGAGKETLRTSAEARRGNAPMVGYYGASARTEVEVNYSAAPSFRIVNGESLYVEIEAGTAENARSFIYEVTVTAADGSGSAVTYMKPANLMGFTSGVTLREGLSTYRITLDSMESGRQLKNILPDVTPGADLVVRVKVTEPGKLPTSATKTDNSLFARVDGGEATLLCGRHLQNLDPSFSGVDQNGKATVTSAVQGKSLDWAALYPGRGFHPIENPALLSFDGQGNAISNLTVNETGADASGLFAVFGSASARGTLRRVRLTDPAVTASQGRAGALAGAVTNADVTDCRVTVGTGGTVTGEGTGLTLGGLAGALTDSAVRDCAVELEGSVGGDTVSGLVGGLVGAVTGSTLERCAVELRGTVSGSYDSSLVGGLAGEMGGTALRSCAVSCDTEAVKDNKLIGSYAGALVGHTLSGTEIDSSFATVGEVSAKTAAGGLIGWVEGSAAVTRSFSNIGYRALNGTELMWENGLGGAGRVSGFLGLVSGGGTVTVTDCYAVGQLQGQVLSGFAGVAAGAAPAFTNCYAAVVYPGDFSIDTTLTYAGFADGGADTNCYFLWANRVDGSGRGSAVRYTELAEKADDMGRAWEAASADATHPYGCAADEGYPFPKLTVLDHYGDWPTKTLNRMALAYYEDYADDGSRGWFGGEINALRDASAAGSVFGVTVTGDGYALLSDDPYVDVVQGRYWGSTGWTDLTLTASAVTIGSQDYQAFYVEDDLLSRLTPLSTGTSYACMQLEGEDYYFIPQFAKTAWNVAGEQPTADPAELSIRAPRHLSALSQTSRMWGAERSFVQELDMDVTGSSYPLQPIGSASDPFRGSYSGVNGHTISGLSHDLAWMDHVGLFGYTGGARIADLILLGGGSKMAGGVNAGPLVGYMGGGSVSGCLASGFQVSGTNAGGLVGQMNGGSITGSAAANGNFTARQTHGGSVSGTASGGLVGLAPAGTVSGCYALASGAGLTGGLLGGGAVTTVTACYCAGYNANTGRYVTTTLGGCTEYNGHNYAALRNFTGFTGAVTLANSHPWDPAELPEAYPLKGRVTRNGALVHYGNWPLERLSGVVYYERYSDGTYGYYGFTTENEAIDTLIDQGSYGSSFGVTVTADGYGVISEDDLVRPFNSVRYNGAEVTMPSTGTATTTRVGAETAEYTLYPFPTSMMVSGTGSAKTVQVDDSTYYYISEFGRAVFKANPGTPNSGYTYAIRSPRHLNVLQTTASLWSRSFAQELDVDFTGTTYTPVPIGSSSTRFTGTYRGQGGHTVTGMSLDRGTQDYVGFFGNTNGATISDLIFLGTGATPIRGGDYVGGLIGFMEGGTVTNCMAAGFAISGSTHVGGFVGANGAYGSSRRGGHIQSCAAVNGAFSGTNGVAAAGVTSTSSMRDGLYRGSYTGGFAGSNSGGIIEDSYAVAAISASNIDYAAGFSGCNYSSLGDRTSILRNNYCAAIGTSGTFARAITDTNTTFGGEVTNCTAYQGTTSSYDTLAALAGGRADAAHTAPFTAALRGRPYPFRANVTRNGAYVHYGNWPERSEYDWNGGIGMAYYESNGGGQQANIIGMSADGSPIRKTGSGGNIKQFLILLPETMTLTSVSVFNTSDVRLDTPLTGLTSAKLDNKFGYGGNGFALAESALTGAGAQKMAGTEYYHIVINAAEVSDPTKKYAVDFYFAYSDKNSVSTLPPEAG